MNNRFVVNLKRHNCLDTTTVSLKHRAERLRLGHGTRKAIKQKTILGIGLLQSLFDHRNHQSIGDQLSPIHVALSLHPQRALLANSGPKEIPRRNLGNPEITGQNLSLSSLSDTGRAKQDDLFLHRPAPRRFDFFIRPSY